MKRLIVRFIFVALLLLTFASSLEKDFSVNPSIIKAAIKEGEGINYPVSLVNSGQSKSFDIYHSGELDFISTDKTDLTVNENDAAGFNVVLQSNKPGVYVDNIVISNDDNAIKVPIILEVESKSILFDIRARIAPRNFEVKPGEQLLVDINLWNIEALNKNVDVEYYIVDLKGNIIVFENDSFSTDDSLVLRKSFLIPEDLEIGDYVFYAYAKQGDSLGTTSLLFYVGEYIDLSPEFNFDFSDYTYFIGGIILVLIAGIFLFNYFTDKKLLQAVAWKRRILDIKRDSGNIHEAISKLIYQRELLGKAYEKDYIRRQSFDEGSKSIDTSIKKLKKKLL